MSNNLFLIANCTRQTFAWQIVLKSLAAARSFPYGKLHLLKINWIPFCLMEELLMQEISHNNLKSVDEWDLFKQTDERFREIITIGNDKSLQRKVKGYQEITNASKLRDFYSRDNHYQRHSYSNTSRPLTFVYIHRSWFLSNKLDRDFIGSCVHVACLEHELPERNCKLACHDTWKGRYIVLWRGLICSHAWPFAFLFIHV